MIKPSLHFKSAMVLVTQDSSTTYVFVEGENDRKLLERFVQERQVKVWTPHEDDEGEQNRKKLVISLIRELNEKKRKNVVGIIDADFNHILGFDSVKNLVRTEGHDFQIDMLMTEVLRDVLRIIASPKKTAQKYGPESDAAHHSILDQALEIAAKYGIPKLVCCKSYLLLRNGPIEIPRLPDLDTYCKWRRGQLTDQYERYVEDLKREHLHVDFTNEIASEMAEEHDAKQLARGHDVTHIICQIIKPVILSRYGTNRRRELLEDMLVATLSKDQFSKLHIFRALSSWESVNHRRILQS